MCHEIQIHHIALETIIFMISMSHEIQNHNIALESIIIMIGVLLGQKSNEKAE